MNILTCVLLLVGLPHTLACDCLKYSPIKILQEEICDADFVVAFYIIRHEDSGNQNADIRYVGRIMNVFKYREDMPERRPFKLENDEIYTYANQDKCGLPLISKVTYVLSDGKMWISLCDLNFPGNDIPCSMKDYLRGCDSTCQIVRCGSGSCQPNGPTHCSYRRNDYENIYSYACVKDGPICTWRQCPKMTMFGETEDRETINKPFFADDMAASPDVDPGSGHNDDDMPGSPISEQNQSNGSYVDPYYNGTGGITYL